MELADALLFEISREVEFRLAEVKYHEKTKALVENLSAEVDQVTRENQRLKKVFDELEEQLYSSKQACLRRLTQDLELAQADVESLRVKWGRTALARDEQLAINVTLIDRIAQLKL